MFKIKHLTRSAAGLLLAATVAVGGLALPSSPVYAQDGEKPAPPPRCERPEEGDTAAETAFIECLYVRANFALERQGKLLEKAADVITHSQEIFADLKDEGYDIGPLEEALAAFQTSLAEAQGYHDDAAAILAGHAGFDDEGKVTDLETAKETLLSVRESLGDAQRTLRRAFRDLRIAARDWREDNDLPYGGPGDGKAKDGKAKDKGKDKGKDK